MVFIQESRPEWLGKIRIQTNNPPACNERLISQGDSFSLGNQLNDTKEEEFMPLICS